MLDSSRRPLLLLRSIGARTGTLRETPLAAVPLEDGRIYVVGSNFARQEHPAWTANLLARPQAEITFRGRTTQVTARLLSDPERDAAWEQLVAVFPAWARYTTVTDRSFRVFEFTPVDT